MNLICLKCGKGIIQWYDPQVNDLDDSMTCTACNYTYEGMGEYIKIMNELHKVAEEGEGD